MLGLTEQNCLFEKQQQQTLNRSVGQMKGYNLDNRYLVYLLATVVIVLVFSTETYYTKVQQESNNLMTLQSTDSQLLRTQPGQQQANVKILADATPFIMKHIQQQSNQQNKSIGNYHHLVKVNRLLQGQSSDDSDTPLAKYILLIIIILFVVVPFVSLIIFGLVVLYNRLRGGNEGNQQNQQQQIQVQVNIKDFKIDEIGPYLSNPNDQCSICLDKQTNIRTFCGHFFHGQCLKAWYDKKTTDGRSPTCPVCVGSQINPVKIYCKKCSVSVKLATIYCETPSQKIDELSELKCNQCRDETLGSQTTQNIKKDKKIKDKKVVNHQHPLQSVQKLYIDSISI